MLFSSAIEKLVEDVALELFPAIELVVALIELTVVERVVPVAVSVAVTNVVDQLDVVVLLLLPQVVIVQVSEVVLLAVTELLLTELVVASSKAITRPRSKAAAVSVLVAVADTSRGL